MRKDVRLGFAVGGVLLAVIIVAVLVMHRNKPIGNKVALDLNGRPAGPVDGATDVDVSTPPSASAQNNPQSQSQPPAAQPDLSRRGNENNAAKANDPERPTNDSSGSAGDKWDQLFVSTSADPIKELNTAKPKKSAPQPDVSAQNNASVADVRPDGDVNPGIDSPAARTMVSERPTTRPSDGATPRTHRVAQNETFVSIAKMIYGEERYFKAIERANPTVNPARLRPGMVIQLPAKADLQPGAAKSSPAPSAAKSAPATGGSGLSADGSTYTVQKDDNLYKISRKLYGNGSKGDELYTANKEKIGSDPTKLKVGMVLKVPEKPTVASR